MTQQHETDLHSASSIDWSDSLLLGFPELDETHKEFVGCVKALQTASDDEIASRLEAVAAHLKLHLGQEDEWMVETEFPPRECHMDEHAAVLESMAQVQQLVVEGNLNEARRLAAALAEWFPRHTTHLDSALSHWMSKKRWNAKPVVLRRNVVAGS
jgi:hemerythrin